MFTLFDIKHNISILPESPGVYIMKDKDADVIYVGKAKNLKKRVSQYFRKTQNHSEKTRSLVKNIVEFEYIVTENEIEALILEDGLIKKHQPKYNILLKDDKTYPFIKITINEDFPRVFSTKNYIKDGNLYFGPFPSINSVNEIMSLIRSYFLVRNCRIHIKDGVIACRPCIYYQTKRCNAPCYGLISKEKYGEMISEIIDILNGKSKDSILNLLKEQMLKHSENLEYEQARDIRDKIEGIKLIFEKQSIFSGGENAEDYINIFRYDNEACVQVFFLRNGRVVGREHFIFENIMGDKDENIIEQFIKSYYGGTTQIPNYIYSPEFLDKDNIEKWINIKSKRKVYFKTPKSGDKKELFDLVRKNARVMLDRFKKNKYLCSVEIKSDYLNELKDILSMNSKIDRIEAYDISNISGFDSVGSMVVFNNGIPNKTQYRRFKIKSVQGSDDYKSMKEILSRRFEHALKEIKCIQEGELEHTYGKFCIFPDLILVDGGRGHISAVEEVLKSFNINIAVCGMVKDDKHRTRGLIYKNQELNISSELIKFITRVQDEVHRYAITYHRSLRDKRSLGSILDEIPNIGSKRRRNLLMYFNSVDGIKKASIDDLLKVPSMNRSSSESVLKFFNKSKT